MVAELPRNGVETHRMIANIPSNNLVPGRKPPGPGAKSTKLRELLELQENMYRRAVDPETKPVQAASCARVFKELEQVRQLLLGNAPPAPVKVEPKRAGRTSVSVSRVRPDVIQVAQGANPPSGADPAS